MHLSKAILSLALLPSTLIPCILAQNYNRSSKRGLIYIPPAEGNNGDDATWVSKGSDLTWYYNYGPLPNPQFTNDSSFEFVPMFFSPSKTVDFGDTIKNLTKAGTNVTYVLSYNEPDGSTGSGGSSLKASDAAVAWKTQLEPLRKLGIKLGAPAVTGSPGGVQWLEDFFDACDGGCTADFMAVHWYGDFPGLSSYIEQKRSAYPNLTQWITEYAIPNVDLNATQTFFNQSAEYFDSLDYVTRYSYFGSFRSSVSNVGPNVAMLDKKGQLTDIGSWYLGGAKTGNTPNGGNGVVGAGIWAVLLIIGGYLLDGVMW